MMWKVSAEKVEVFEHPNADKLQIAKVGDFDLVIGKGSLKDGDTVLFAPKRTIMPEYMFPAYLNSRGETMLRGPKKNRVSSIRLRGELSEGVLVPFDMVKERLGVDNIHDITIGEDISSKLDMKEFIPIDRVSNTNNVYVMPKFNGMNPNRHDVFSLPTTSKYLEGNEVTVTEKIHGSQIAIIFNKNKDTNEFAVFISSKGLLGKGVLITESPDNVYWRAFYHSNIKELVNKYFHRYELVEVFGEVIPFQNGFSYGTDVGNANKTILIFRIDIILKVLLNGIPKVVTRTLSIKEIENDYPQILHEWVPILYEGEYNKDKIKALANGTETVSGKGLHIKEGVVIALSVPQQLRDSSDGYIVSAKLINKKFKDNDDDIS